MMKFLLFKCLSEYLLVMIYRMKVNSLFLDNVFSTDEE